MALKIREAQRNHQATHDVETIKYNEIKEFMNQSSLWLSTRIFNNKDKDKDLLDKLHKEYLKLLPKYKEILETVEKMNQMETDFYGEDNLLK